LKNRFFGIFFLANRFMPGTIFDRSALKIKPLSQRIQDKHFDDNQLWSYAQKAI
jgi:hypothetical protein